MARGQIEPIVIETDRNPENKNKFELCWDWVMEKLHIAFSHALLGFALISLILGAYFFGSWRNTGVSDASADMIRHGLTAQGEALDGLYHSCGPNYTKWGCQAAFQKMGELYTTTAHTAPSFAEVVVPR